MSKAPLVSVCIPAFNDASYLRPAVLSVLGQTFPDFEIVIVDDASNDGTMETIRDIEDPRLRRYSNETNLGGEGNWNKAVSLAQGSFIKVLCSDDLLYPECLEEQVRVLTDQDSAAIGLVSCWRTVINAGGKRIMVRRPAALRGHVSRKTALARIARSGTNPIGEPAAVLFKREIFEKAGPFNGSNPFLLDLDMWARMLLHGDLFMIPRILCAFRVEPDSWSVRLAREQSRSYRRWLLRVAGDPQFGFSKCAAGLGFVKSVFWSGARRCVYRCVAWRQGS